jgi:hypothetical protein
MQRYYRYLILRCPEDVMYSRSAFPVVCVYVHVQVKTVLRRLTRLEPSIRVRKLILFLLTMHVIKDNILERQFILVTGFTWRCTALSKGRVQVTPPQPEKNAAAKVKVGGAPTVFQRRRRWGYSAAAGGLYSRC